MVELRIDPEFRDKIPPLTDAEFEQLRENILADGEVYEPIAVWNGVIVDGHNRWRVIREHPEIPYKVKEIEFTNKWEAFAWMYKKQLGRRNLSDEQKTYLMGKRNEAEKLAVGAPSKKVQNGPLRAKGKTAQRIADEYGVGYGTVLRAEQFAKGVDALSEVSKEAADKILSGTAKVPKAAVAELKEADQETVQKFAEDVIANRPVKVKPPRPMSPQMKDFSKQLLSVVSEMENPNKGYILDDAIRDLNSAEEVFMNQVNFVLTERASVFENDEDGYAQVVGFIETAIQDLNELKGEVNKWKRK